MALFNHLAFIAVGFLSGCVLYSYVIPLALLKKNIVKCSPDGNPGGANAFTYAGKFIGIICIILDIAKGFFPVFFAYRILDGESFYFIAVILAPVLGHAVAPFNSVKGGKCIAVSFGVLLGLVPHSYCVFILAVFYIALCFAFRHKPNSLKSIYAFSLFSIIMIILCIFSHKLPITISCISVSVIVIYKHICQKQNADAKECDTEEEKELI